MIRSSALSLAAGLLVGTTITAGFAASLTLTSQTFTPYRTCTLTATPASTSAVADAQVRESAPATNFGANASLSIRSGTGSNRRTYISFDLTACMPGIPSSATVRLASLRLFVTALPVVCRTYDVFSATSVWSEGTITWNNQPFGTSLNNPPTASRSTSFDIGSAGGCQNAANNAYLSATLTSAVQSFVTGGTSNFGWMLRDDTENAGAVATSTFSSKDAGIIAQAPQLVVTYVAVP